MLTSLLDPKEIHHIIKLLKIKTIGLMVRSIDMMVNSDQLIVMDKETFFLFLIHSSFYKVL